MIPRLMPWSSSPPAGEATSTNRSTRSATATSDWPDADRLDDHEVEAGGLAQRASPRACRRATPPRVPDERGRADEGVRVAGEVAHPRLVAEDRAAGADARRVDGEDGDPLAVLDGVEAERLDQGGLARPRGAGQPERGSPGRCRGGASASSWRRVVRGGRRVVDSTSGDRRGERRGGRPPAGPRPSERPSSVHHGDGRLSRRGARRRRSRTVARGVGDVGAGPEDGHHAGVAQSRRGPAAGSRHRTRRGCRRRPASAARR